MRICVICVYWTLLLISVVSSALLFLIVASEGAQVNQRPSSVENNASFGVYDNVRLDNIGNDNLDSSIITIVQVEDAMTLDGTHKNLQEEHTVSASFENVISDGTQQDNPSFEDPDIIAESLTQQPNLSQGISETGQPVVLTLVDTAAAELQSLAEPKINSEFLRAKSFPKNSSQTTSDGNSGQNTEGTPQESAPSTQIPSPPIVDEATEKPNDTGVLDEEILLIQESLEEEMPEVVVVVRAEQNPIASDDSALRLEDKVVRILPDEARVEDAFVAVSELNDTAIRARLVTRDEAAAVLLGDGIVTAGPTNPQEDIPSFSEWAQKRLEEAEKKKTHSNASVQNSGGPGRGIGGMKVRSKNYASPDCGAKIVAANPEARSAKSVLASTRDEYMLNTCTSRIWFIVELCEAIQAKKIELANFELFSSSPKDFSVYVSDRFPTRDWSPVGQFTAKDGKDIQNFALHPHLFGKFIKVELHTYYGSEHFCPISLFRAYGTSEFEVLETETENQVSSETDPNVEDSEDSDEEEPLDADSGEPPRNLFGSARDAVLSIVKKAAEVLVKSSDLTRNNITNIQQSIDGGNILDDFYISCTTPRYTILCNNCSDQKFAKVFQLVSCRERQLNELLNVDVIIDTLRGSEFCSMHRVKTGDVEIKVNQKDNSDMGNTERQYNQDKTRFETAKNSPLLFLTSIFKSEYIIALCNVLTTKERKVVMNMSYEVPSNSSDDLIKEDISMTKAGEQSNDMISPIIRITQDLYTEKSEEILSASVEPWTSSSFENMPLQIKPTKTLSKEDTRKEASIPILESNTEPAEEIVETEVITTIPLPSTITNKLNLQSSDEVLSILGTSIETAPETNFPSLAAFDSKESLNENDGSTVENLEMIGIQNKLEKFEKSDEEGQHGKPDVGEQELKLSPHDSLTFDSLLSDLKDLDSEAVHLHNGHVASVSSSQHTTNTMPQKESVFLRLSNRIKALERNMSLSGQYLEELSRRYKKQVEEMQRSLERAVSAMNEESRKGEERDSKRLEEIVSLREEIAALSNAVKSLLYDRDSWRGRFSIIGQHALLISFEVILVILILSYCRKSGKFERTEKQQSATKKDAVRRKSAENFSSHEKKTKKRRPSEIASHITGTYYELMIEDKCHESKKERKRKRKKEATVGCHKTLITSDAKTVSNAVPSDIEMLPRRALSIDVPTLSDVQNQVCKRPKSEPGTTVGWLDADVRKTEHHTHLNLLDNVGYETETHNSSGSNSSRIRDHNRSNSLTVNMNTSEGLRLHEQRFLRVECTKNTARSKSNRILKDPKLSPPSSSFIKTTLVSRKLRKATSNGESWETNQNLNDLDNCSFQTTSTGTIPFSETIGNTNGTLTANGAATDRSDDSRSSSASSTLAKKDKKRIGLKKMVRKLF